MAKSAARRLANAEASWTHGLYADPSPQPETEAA